MFPLIEHFFHCIIIFLLLFFISFLFFLFLFIISMVDTKDISLFLYFNLFFTDFEKISIYLIFSCYYWKLFCYFWCSFNFSFYHLFLNRNITNSIPWVTSSDSQRNVINSLKIDSYLLFDLVGERNRLSLFWSSADKFRFLWCLNTNGRQTCTKVIFTSYV